MAGSVALLGMTALRDRLTELEDGFATGTIAEADIQTRLRAIRLMVP